MKSMNLILGIDGILNDETGEHVAKDGGNMNEGAFALALGLDKFVGIDAQEFARGVLPLALISFT